MHAPARQENVVAGRVALTKRWGNHNKLPLRGGRECCVLPQFIRKSNSIPCTQILNGSPPFAIQILDAFGDTLRCPLHTRRGGVNCDVFGDTLRRACTRTTGNARSMWCFNSWCMRPHGRKMWWRDASPSQNVGETRINCRSAEGRSFVYYHSS